MKKSTKYRTWKLKVDGRAEHFLPSALTCFAAANKRQLVCDEMKVQFIGAGEAGAAEEDEDDEDHTSRMWAMLMRQLCDPTHGLFERCVPADAASSLVPCARVDEDSERHRHVGRVILRALLDSRRLPKEFVAGAAEGEQQPCSFVLSYVLAPNDTEEADRLSIGTCGTPREGQAAAEADAVLETLGRVSPALTAALRGALDGGVSAALDGGVGAVAAEVCGGEATREARARAVCLYVHGQLIGVRRAALEALKEGFTAQLDMRAALRLFQPHELLSLFCAEHDDHEVRS